MAILVQDSAARQIQMALHSPRPNLIPQKVMPDKRWTSAPPE